MSGHKRRSNKSRNTNKPRPDPVTFWREDEEPEEATPVILPADPTALLRSLGPPPIPNAEAVNTEFLKTVLRASSLAGALAASVDLIDDHDDDSTS